MDPFGFRPPNQSWNHNYYQQPFFHQPQNRGFNFIQKILGKNQGHFGGPPQQMFGYGPGMASKYHSLHETLNHIQKGLGLIQQVSPYIKQYGPFVKNLPMIIDMMKIMMENEDEIDYDKQETKDEELKDMTEKILNDDQHEPQEQEKKKSQQKHKKDRHSNEVPNPKMYI